MAHSSAESEYVALSMGGRECMWLCRLHAEIDGASVNPTLISGDNQACALWTENPIHHSRQKHIGTAHHAIHDWANERHIAACYISSLQINWQICPPRLC